MSDTTIMFGSGAYFDYANPCADEMTLEDAVWGMCKPRFGGQTRYDGRRCLYFVPQHCVLTSRKIMEDGHGDEAALDALFHEDDEVVWDDFTSPSKKLLPVDLKSLIARTGKIIGDRFGRPRTHGALVKEYDLRMLATEKRDLMPHDRDGRCKITDGVEPFDFHVVPQPDFQAVQSFIWHYEMLTQRLALREQIKLDQLASRPFVTDECPCAGCSGTVGAIATCQAAA